ISTNHIAHRDATSQLALAGCRRDSACNSILPPRHSLRIRPGPDTFSRNDRCAAVVGFAAGDHSEADAVAARAVLRLLTHQHGLRRLAGILPGPIHAAVQHALRGKLSWISLICSSR